MVQVRDPLGNLATRSYNDRGLLESWRDGTLHNAVPREWSYDYDPTSGLRTAETDPAGFSVTYADFDGFDRYREVIREWRDYVAGVPTPPNQWVSATTTLSYDHSGGIKTALDPLGNLTRYTRDPYGRQTAYTDPLDKTESSPYDDDGRISTRTLRDGTTQAANTYDDAGRLTYVDWTGAPWEERRYAADGLVEYARNSAAWWIYAYDEDRRLAQKYDANRPIRHEYEYDPYRGYLSRVWTPGRAFLLHRDASDREDLISVEGSTTSVWIDYDLAGRLLREEFRESGQARVIVDYEFDEAGRLLTKMATLPDEDLLYGVSYTYDVRGLVETIAESDEEGVINVRTFVHDEVGRLVWADYTDGPASWEYHYDWAGNRTREIYEGITTDYTIVAGNRLYRVTDSGITHTFGYDDNGSVISWTVGTETDTYGYNAPGRMTSADVDSGLWTYGYDVDAWRVSKSGPGNVDLYYFRDQRTLDERTGSGAGTIETQVFFRPDGFTPLLLCDDTTCHYVFTDHLGTPLRVFDLAGGTAWAGTLAPFGELLEGEFGSLAGRMPLRFPGQ